MEQRNIIGEPPLAVALAAKEDKSSKGQSSGYAPLDSGQVVPVVNLPAASASTSGIMRGLTSATTTALGIGAYNSTATGGQITVIGLNSGAALTTGTANVAVGAQSLRSMTTGINNVSIGTGTLEANVTGNNNVAIGYQSLNALTGSGTTYNVAVGTRALYLLTSGTHNTCVGFQTGSGLLTGGNNTIVGAVAFTSGTGDNNTAIGRLALTAATTASNNTTLGSNSGSTITIGARNTLIGTGTSITAPEGNDRIALGYNASAAVDGELAIAPAITQIKATGLGTGDATGTLLTIDAGGVIKKTSGTYTTPAAISTAFDSKIDTSARGASNGVAPLGSDVKIAYNYLPTPFMWSARPTADKNYGGTTAQLINNLAVEHGNASYLTSGSTFNVSATGYWEISMYIYRDTSSAGATGGNMEVWHNGTTSLHTWENPMSSSNWSSQGGTVSYPLTAGDTIQLRFTLGGSSPSISIKRTGTVLQMRYLGELYQ